MLLPILKAVFGRRKCESLSAWCDSDEKRFRFETTLDRDAGWKRFGRCRGCQVHFVQDRSLDSFAAFVKIGSASKAKIRVHLLLLAVPRSASTKLQQVLACFLSFPSYLTLSLYPSVPAQFALWQLHCTPQRCQPISFTRAQSQTLSSSTAFP